MPARSSRARRRPFYRLPGPADRCRRAGALWRQGVRAWPGRDKKTRAGFPARVVP